VVAAVQQIVVVLTGGIRQRLRLLRHLPTVMLLWYHSFYFTNLVNKTPSFKYFRVFYEPVNAWYGFFQKNGSVSNTGRLFMVSVIGVPYARNGQHLVVSASGTYPYVP
jgi:hypothetical protein